MVTKTLTPFSRHITLTIKVWFLMLLAAFCACREEKINTLPVASLEVFPYAGDSLTIYTFDAYKSSDKEDIVEKLSARWDWESDGVWDSDFSHQLKVLHRFTQRGIIHIRMELLDSDGSTVTISDSVRVFELPVYGGLYTWYEAMDYVETEGGQGLCPPGWHIPSLKEWRTIAPSDVPYLFLNYFLGPGGPGGLNLRYDGLYIIYTEKNGGIINRKFFSGLGELAGFWTSTFRVNTLESFYGKAKQRSNYGLWLVDVQNPGIGYWDRNGLFPGGDLIHLSGDTLVYETGGGSYRHFHIAYSVRCIKSE